MTLRALEPADFHPATQIAQLFLGGAFDSVHGVLASLNIVRDVRRQRTLDIRGRLASNEEDLLRAAVVFAGAGLDAALKQLIRDSLPLLLERSPQAHTKFETFTEHRLRCAEGIDLRQLARYLTAGDLRARLIEDYVQELTGSSLQSADEVQRTAGALGIGDATLRMRIERLNPVFEARNQISHELDLQTPRGQGDRTKRTRRMQPTVNLCHDALDTAQRIINEVVRILS